MIKFSLSKYNLLDQCFISDVNKCFYALVFCKLQQVYAHQSRDSGIKKIVFQNNGRSKNIESTDRNHRKHTAERITEEI